MAKFIAGFFCLVLSLTSYGRSIDNDNPILTGVYDMTLRVQKAGNIAISVTNYGELGSRGGDIHDPSLDPSSRTPSLEFPKYSGIEYLFMGPIWIGARVENTEIPGQYDTLVSIANDGWWSGIMELVPPDDGYESMRRQRLTGDEEYVAEYYDTALTGVTQDPNDGRPHLPLGLKITQHSYSWSSPGYDEFVIIEYTLENIYSRDLHDIWFGIMLDGDAFHISENPFAPEGGAQDDLSGIIDYNGKGIAWIIDNNGQPYNNAFTDSSVTGIVGLMLLNSSVQNLQTNFNWWIPHVVSAYDWGPQRLENYTGPYPGGGNGTPGGDIGKYRMMSNGERDYDQAYCALDWTDEGWIDCNLMDPANVANGFDTRFLLSWGSFDIAPGEAETLTVAILAGHDLHIDPQNYADNLQYLTGDSLAINAYYENLDFTGLFMAADTIIGYGNSLQSIPIGYPDDFRISSWSDSLIELSWSELNHPLFSEFKLYRGFEPGIYDSIPITPVGYSDTIFSDHDITDNTSYYYVISAVNGQSVEGGLSFEVTMNSGQPQTPANLTAAGGDSEIHLSWNPNPDADLLGYIVFRNSPYEPEGVFVIIDTTIDISYVDMNIVNGYTYNYTLKALDNFGNASPASDTVSAAAINQGSDILFVHANTNNPVINPDYQSMIEYYYYLLENTSYNFTLVNRAPYNLVELANHGILIWSRDLPYGGVDFGISTELIENYLDIGGKLILTGPRNLVTATFEGSRQFQPNDFAYDYLNLFGLEYPDIMTTEFIGGESVNPFFPDFDLDTSKTNRIVVPDSSNDGRLFGMGMIDPGDSLEVIYDFVAVEPDTSTYHGRPIAIIHHDDDFAAAYCEFPLYYVEQAQAIPIFNQLLEVIQEVGIDDEPAANIPEKTSLLYSYPNPFNVVTTIKYELSRPADVAIDIYDILGRRVDSMALGRQAAGLQTAVWQAQNQSSGIYFIRLQAEESIMVCKCVLLK